MRSSQEWTSDRVVFLAIVTLAIFAHEPAPLAAAGENVAPVEMKLPPDLVFEKNVGRDQAVTFRHTTHVDFAAGKCVPCHPEPFRMLDPVRTTSHDAMKAGGSCGICHDGTKAFATTTEKSCATCHAGPAAATGSTAKDVTFRSSESSPGVVVFRHASHASSKCGICHDTTFAMRAGGTKVGSPSDLHGKCGVCHDATKTFGVEDSDACARCHSGEGARS